jgi:hypothetical protein
MGLQLILSIVYVSLFGQTSEDRPISPSSELEVLVVDERGRTITDFRFEAVLHEETNRDYVAKCRAAVCKGLPQGHYRLAVQTARVSTSTRVTVDRSQVWLLVDCGFRLEEVVKASRANKRVIVGDFRTLGKKGSRSWVRIVRVTQPDEPGTTVGLDELGRFRAFQFWEGSYVVNVLTEGVLTEACQFYVPFEAALMVIGPPSTSGGRQCHRISAAGPSGTEIRLK